jgi:hypothetical protein
MGGCRKVHKNKTRVRTSDETRRNWESKNFKIEISLKSEGADE